MIKDGNMWRGLAATSAALLLSACAGAGHKAEVDTVDAAMLSDQEATAASHRLIRLQERPTFPVDERNRAYAMVADRDDKRQTGDAPVSIRESKP